MAYICQQRYFDPKYSYPTWELTDATEKFRGDHEEKLEYALVHRDPDQPTSEFVDEVCGMKQTKACRDVNPEDLKDLKPPY